MPSVSYSDPVALLYYVCFLILAGLALFVAAQHPPDTHSRLRRVFLYLVFFLLVWMVTLFMEVRVTALPVQLWLGRMNFASIALVVYQALRFIDELPRSLSHRRHSLRFWLQAETVILAGVTLFTPLIDQAERVEEGRAITTFGSLFPVYLVHVLGYFVASLFLSYRKCLWCSELERQQLLWIGVGICLTGCVSLYSNAVLPFVYHDFDYSDAGPVSCLLFAMAVAYATFIHGLFSSRVLVRKTLVYGLLLAFVVGAYSSSVFVISLYLSNSTGKLTQFAVLLIAFSFDPVRRFLEKKVDELLFGRRERKSKRP